MRRARRPDPKPTATLTIGRQPRGGVSKSKATVRVAENLFRKATGEGREAITAAIFWLKTRAGWRELQIVEAEVRYIARMPEPVASGEEWFERYRPVIEDGTGRPLETAEFVRRLLASPRSAGAVQAWVLRRNEPPSLGSQRAKTSAKSPSSWRSKRARDQTPWNAGRTSLPRSRRLGPRSVLSSSPRSIASRGMSPSSRV